VLKRLLEALPAPRAYRAAEQHSQQGKIAGDVDLLGIDQQLDPEPHPVPSAPAVVGGAGPLPNPASEP
jgi:hypothetical protein